MKIIIQRVKKPKWVSKVRFREKSIRDSYCWLVLAQRTKEDLDYAVRKLVNMRIFQTQKARWTCLSKILKGNPLFQFTLFADTKKGNRPAFTGAAKPDMASDFYDAFNQKISARSTRSDRYLWSGYAGLSWSMMDQLPLSLILKIDKKDQPSWLGFLSLQNTRKWNLFLIGLGKVFFPGFGLCDRKGMRCPRDEESSLKAKWDTT